MKRRLGAGFVVTLAGLAALSFADSATAQTIEPYYNDASSYDTQGVHITDHYAITPSTCLIENGATVDVDRTPIRITLLVRPFSSCDVPGGRDLTVDRMVWLPAALSPGTYAVEFGYLIGGNWIFRNSTSFVVNRGIDKCSRFPEHNSLIVSANDTVANRLAGVALNPALDPVLHEKLGRPISAYRLYAIGGVILDYAPLDDTQDIKRRIDSIRSELGIDAVETNGFVCFALSAGSEPIEIVEFYNFLLGHYFMTADTAEIASIESGGAGPFWSRTGERFTGFAADACSQLGVRNPMPLFRFYGTRGVGPNSHFFTADRSECGKVRHDPGWTFESVPFRVWTPVAGQCPAKSLPIHRLYNGRAAQNDSNHRYASRQVIVDAMVGSGWTNEGVTLCIPQL